MKYLSDSEILSWNKRIEKSDYCVFAQYNNRSSHPDISYRQKVKNQYSDVFVPITEPFMRFQFVFSIASNREEFFFDILKRLRLEKIGTKSSYSQKSSPNSEETKISDITVNEGIVENVDKEVHNFFEKEYVRYRYTFAGKLGSIMAYVSYLEDAIKYFSMIWGYSEEGHEVCLIKYPIGTIVSPIKEKSKDFLILEYKFTKIGSNYHIDYIASEVLSKSVVISYGEVLEFKESDICFSRNNRIDNILN